MFLQRAIKAVKMQLSSCSGGAPLFFADVCTWGSTQNIDTETLIVFAEHLHSETK